MEQEQHQHLDTPSQPRRRTLLNRMWALIALLAFVELGWLSSSVLRARKRRYERREGSRYVEAGRVESFKAGDVRAVP